MKSMTRLTISLLVLVVMNTASAEDQIQLVERKPSINAEEHLYKIEENEVIVNDKLITLFAISKDGISASYRNKTEEKTKPKYTIEVYNAYGLLIGKETLGDGISLFGSSTYMEPGEVSAEKIHLDEYPLIEILKHSNFKSPDNLMEMKWIVLSETNTK